MWESNGFFKFYFDHRFSAAQSEKFDSQNKDFGRAHQIKYCFSNYVELDAIEAKITDEKDKSRGPDWRRRTIGTR